MFRTHKGPGTSTMTRTLSFCIQGIVNAVWAKYSLLEVLDPLGTDLGSILASLGAYILPLWPWLISGTGLAGPQR